MNPLLIQFIAEARDFLASISEKLLSLEGAPDNTDLMAELFRLVHTLKGNSGLFDYPEMTRVLHAGEDLMDAVRDGRVAYSSELADRLLSAMDFVQELIVEIEIKNSISPSQSIPSKEISDRLRELISNKSTESIAADIVNYNGSHDGYAEIKPEYLELIGEQISREAVKKSLSGHTLLWIEYKPEPECFFKGEDPLNQVRNCPGLIWAKSSCRENLLDVQFYDCYRCLLDFHFLVSASNAEIESYFRYIPEQIMVSTIDPLSLIVPQGFLYEDSNFNDYYNEAASLLSQYESAQLTALTQKYLTIFLPGSWLVSALRWILVLIESTSHQNSILTLLNASKTQTKPIWTVAEDESNFLLASDRTDYLNEILHAQIDILSINDDTPWTNGRLKSTTNTLLACFKNDPALMTEISTLAEKTLTENTPKYLLEWLTVFLSNISTLNNAVPFAAPLARETENAVVDSKYLHRVEDNHLGKVLKVDQFKIDLLMDLIGEMIVAKNSLPYLANRAENQFGVRDLAREIKSQFSVINRIVSEMQDAIMQVRMMEVSVVFQRFPRLVRDIARKLEKEVELVLEGGNTEADKNIIEALADPLIHIVRNSLDHGLESPAERQLQGKPTKGTLLIRAAHESDRVVIEIIDDGKGIDPEVIKHKAHAKGLIDDDQLERISDQEAINLVFLPGFSTAEKISDLSGRGVGMDVVRHAVDKVGGTISLKSERGKGTQLKLSLPLSMSVTHVIIIESDHQIFGAPMEAVVETVRVKSDDIHLIKNQKAILLRNKVIPIFSLNQILKIPAEPICNEENEFAILVMAIGDEHVGLIVDNFREVIDVILKPLPGDLAKISCYSGSALLGDGSVLMVLNPKELF